MQQKWNQNFDGEPMADIPQKFLNAGCDVYMVMQLRHDEKILDERFASMRELHRRGETPDPEHYEVTYYADLPAMWQDVPNNEILEEQNTLCTPPAGGKSQSSGNSSSANYASVSSFSFSITTTDSSRRAVSSGIR